jgi:hypothetical protein
MVRFTCLPLFLGSHYVIWALEKAKKYSRPESNRCLQFCIPPISRRVTCPVRVERRPQLFVLRRRHDTQVCCVTCHCVALLTFFTNLCIAERNELFVQQVPDMVDVSSLVQPSACICRRICAASFRRDTCSAFVASGLVHSRLV